MPMPTSYDAWKQDYPAHYDEPVVCCKNCKDPLEDSELEQKCCHVCNEDRYWETNE